MFLHKVGQLLSFILEAKVNYVSSKQRPWREDLNPFIPKIDTFILLTSTIDFFVGWLREIGALSIKITTLKLIIILILNTCLPDISLKLLGEFTCCSLLAVKGLDPVGCKIGILHFFFYSGIGVMYP